MIFHHQFTLIENDGFEDRKFSIELISEVNQSQYMGFSLSVNTYSKVVIKKNLPRRISANSSKFDFREISHIKIC